MALAPAIALAQNSSSESAPLLAPGVEDLEHPATSPPVWGPGAEPQREPILPAPTPHPPASESDLEETDEPLPTSRPAPPEFRLRAGGGVMLPTTGPTVVYARLTQEVEWQPALLEFLALGFGASEMIGPVTLAQMGARAFAFAWFCADAVARCQGAIGVQMGVLFGALGLRFDLSADVDLRFLFDDRIEIYLRGGFFTVAIDAFLNLSGGLGVAF
jgi:hypothetical protein